MNAESPVGGLYSPAGPRSRPPGRTQRPADTAAGCERLNIITSMHTATGSAAPQVSALPVIWNHTPVVRTAGSSSCCVHRIACVCMLCYTGRPHLVCPHRTVPPQPPAAALPLATTARDTGRAKRIRHHSATHQATVAPSTRTAPQALAGCVPGHGRAPAAPPPPAPPSGDVGLLPSLSAARSTPKPPHQHHGMH